MKDKTGLDYEDSDMTIDQILDFIEEIQAFGRKNIFESVFITGGEPLLNPNIEFITYLIDERLLQEHYINRLFINSNKIKKYPDPILDKYIVNFSLPKDNRNIHQCNLLLPNGKIEQTYDNCEHYRKQRIVLNYQGYSLCCAGDAYTRLMCAEHLILDHLPNSIEEFPNMDEICQICPFHSENPPVYERAVGSPVSSFYTAQAMQNKAGRQITRRYNGIKTRK